MGASREDVWLALSALWLDNQLNEHDHRHIAGVLHASGLPADELRAIYLEEVAPLLWTNHWVAAGAWEGFDPAWLSAGCRRFQALRGRRWHRWRCRLLRRPMTYAAEPEWRQVMARLAELRE
ncbi:MULTISPECIES: hypothetical protein [unclassified Pseudomonas]|uniref:DUF7079 family protein n=1 Tax=unclassified Pseudomonas TaxID=196821 RepID=UPI00244A63AA|nr:MULTISPECIES: hypothetical protein [unclassified Pseudomonas]MDG9930156.1 hypothetical protein [Pseudomonas sp. GD04042]MDH0485801.1 hypothetical protein [Pseudomonas sp. GD04015]MDH0606808.1 hypothetical protein [Pseudomonas sp. GD03869]